MRSPPYTNDDPAVDQPSQSAAGVHTHGGWVDDTSKAAAPQLRNVFGKYPRFEPTRGPSSTVQGRSSTSVEKR